jgi:hypothetical protein
MLSQGRIDQPMRPEELANSVPPYIMGFKTVGYTVSVQMGRTLRNQTDTPPISKVCQ